MKRLLTLLVLCCNGALLLAQFNPPPVSGFVNPGSGWTPLTGNGAGQAVSFNPPPAALYTCVTESNGVCTSWQPWNGASGAAACPTCVLAVSPGVGIAHFVGSTQTVTSSAVNLATADVTGVLPPANGGAGMQAPSWLRFLGTASESAFNCTNGTCAIAGGEHWYPSFNVSAGAIGAVSTIGIAIVRSTGTCTIAGTVSASVNTGSAAGNAGSSNFGTPLAGTGGGGGGGTAGGSAAVAIDTYVQNTAGGTAGTSSGGNAGNGNSTSGTAQYVKLYIDAGPPIGTSGTATIAGFGGTKGGAGGTGAAAGGAGGGVVIFACATINFTGTIDVSGANGTASGANNQGPGGGGGGGVAILAAETFTANSGTVTITGGSGGTCGASTGCGTAGNGATGYNTSFTIQ